MGDFDEFLSEVNEKLSNTHKTNVNLLIRFNTLNRNASFDSNENITIIKKLMKDFINLSIPCTINQHVDVIKHRTSDLITRLEFENGRKVSQKTFQKTNLASRNIIQSVFDITACAHAEKPIRHHNALTDFNSVNVVLSYLFSSEEYIHQDWDILISFSKNINKTIGNKVFHDQDVFNKLLDARGKMFSGDITLDNLIIQSPWAVADKIEVSAIYNSTNIYRSNLDWIIKRMAPLLNQNTNTTPEMIFKKIVRVLKFSHQMIRSFDNNTLGIKQLIKPIVTLDHNMLNKHILGKLSDYVIMDKVDGETCVLYIYNDDMYIATANKVYYTKTVRKFPLSIIADAEINVTNNGMNIHIYPFDVRAYHSYTDINDIDGHILEGRDFAYRSTYIRNIIEDIQTIQTAQKCKFHFHQMRIKELNVENLQLMLNQKQAYETDGVVIVHKRTDYWHTLKFKYKPINTVDFYISKCPVNLVGEPPYTPEDNKYIYVLGCSMDVRMAKSMPTLKLLETDKYFPVLFTPSENPHCNVYKSENPDLHGMIGEFIYSNGGWKLERIRHDRMIEVKRGNYYGNNARTAELTWSVSVHPIVISDFKHNQLVCDWDRRGELFKLITTYIKKPVDTISVYGFNDIDIIANYCSKSYIHVKNMTEYSYAIYSKYMMNRKDLYMDMSIKCNEQYDFEIIDTNILIIHIDYKIPLSQFVTRIQRSKLTIISYNVEYHDLVKHAVTEVRRFGAKAKKSISFDPTIKVCKITF